MSMFRYFVFGIQLVMTIVYEICHIKNRPGVSRTGSGIPDTEYKI
jgi:hypothetical protein